MRVELAPKKCMHEDDFSHERFLPTFSSIWSVGITQSHRRKMTLALGSGFVVGEIKLA